VVRLKHSYRMLLADRVRDDLVAAVRATHPTGDVAAAIDVIANWDKTVAPESRGGMLFELWWAATAVAVEILTRPLKITWSAKAPDIELSFMTALRTTLAGDFGASITPARSGAEPARFLVLAEAGVPTSSALVVLFAELFLESLSLALVVLVVAIVFRHAGIVLGALVGVVGTYSGFVIGLAVTAIMLSRRHVGHSPPTWARRVGLGGRRWLVIQRWFAQIRTTV